MSNLKETMIFNQYWNALVSDINRNKSIAFSAVKNIDCQTYIVPSIGLQISKVIGNYFRTI
jgi:hypothetical protein